MEYVEALEILKLSEGFCDEDLKKAYKTEIFSNSVNNLNNYKKSVNGGDAWEMRKDR